MSVALTATLPVRDRTVLFVSGLLHDERLETSAGAREAGQ
jgi:hypothetical protein